MKMQLTMVGFVLVACVLQNGVLAKAFIPSLDRMRKKVDAALEQPTKKIQEVMQMPATQLSKLGVCITSQQSPEAFFETVEKQLEGLYWARQKELIERLKTLMGSSHNAAAIALRDAIKGKYPNNGSPLVTFAKALNSEKDALKEVSEALAKGLTLVTNPVLLGKHRELTEKCIGYNEHLKKLENATNTLLM